MAIRQYTKIFPLVTTCGVLVSGSALAATSAPAVGVTNMSKLQEITVTATKTGLTKLQDTPISMTAVTAEDIARTGMTDIHGLTAETPNLDIAQNGPFAEIYIRGIGSNNVFIGSDPDVAIYEDGVYIARPSSDFTNFLNVKRVEILRGPQGTLYGRNAVGGAINIISRKPDNTFRAKAEAGIGNYSEYDEQGYISGPIVPGKLYASISGLGERHDGYIKNIYPGGTNLNSQDTYAFRGQVRATPTDNLDILLRGDYSTDSGAVATAQKLLLADPADPLSNKTLGNYHEVALDTPDSQERRNDGVSADIKYTVSDALELSSLTAYRSSYLFSSADTDGSSLPITNSRFLEHQNQFSEEFNASGRFNRVKYVFGIYYFHENIHDDDLIKHLGLNKGLAFAPTVHTDSWAGYGQVTYNLTRKFSATAGYRYTVEKKVFDQNAGIVSLSPTSYLAGPFIYNLSNPYRAGTPKFGLQYQATRDILIYASATRGFKSGGYSDSTTTKINGFGPEYLWSYEAGVKSDWLHHRLRVDGDVFYYNYKDLQVQSFIVPGIINITNAASAHVKGVELDVQAEPVRGLDVGGTLAYLDARYSSFPDALAPGHVVFDATGNYLDQAPKWAYSVYGQYNFEIPAHGTMFVRGEWSWHDTKYFTPDNSQLQSQPAYGLFNASIGYNFPDGHFQVLAYGRNLTNKQYIVNTATFTAEPAAQVGLPRVVGLKATYTY